MGQWKVKFPFFDSKPRYCNRPAPGRYERSIPGRLDGSAPSRERVERRGGEFRKLPQRVSDVGDVVLVGISLESVAERLKPSVAMRVIRITPHHLAIEPGIIEPMPDRGRVEGPNHGEKRRSCSTASR